MDLDIAVTAIELFENNDMVFPILSGRENLKISLASPDSESSGVSSLDADEAKKLANDQLTTSSSPELASEPNSTEQTEGESSDDSSNENEQSSDEEQSQKFSSDDNSKIDEQEQRSPDMADADDIDETEIESIEKADEAEEKDEAEIKEDVSLAETVSAHASDESSVSEEDMDEIRYAKLKIFHGGRDILNLAENLHQSWNNQYTHLPDFNIPMYLANRSQYHRLGASWETHDSKYAFCRRCGFRYPMQVPDEQTAAPAPKAPIAELAAHNSLCSAVSSLVSNNPVSNMMQNLTVASALNRISPISTLNQAASKFPAASTPLPATGSMYNFNNLMNNNQSNTLSFPYQNQIAAPNNMSAYKQQQQQKANVNAFYGNNMTLNTMISQMAMDTTFNPNQNQSQFANGGNGKNYAPNMNQMANNMSATALLNQLMNQTRQNQGGMCRPLANKSGINLNGNSHSKMPAYKMYSHF